MAYLNPNTIVIDDFSTPEYVQADFLIENAGTMNFLEIEIDRTTSTVTKSTIDNITWGNNASIMLSNDLNIPNYIQLNSNHQNTILHPSFLTETSPQSLIKGIVFAIYVKTIFNLDDSQISNIDFVQDNDRLNSIFFDNDPTITCINDIKNASDNDFNKTVTSDGTNNDEYGYWDTQIGPSNNSMIFVDDDKMYSFYGMRLKIITGDTPDISTTNISDIGNLFTPKEFLNIDISKQFQNSDFGGNLTPAQLKYCANDVIYLHKIHEELKKILVRENRMELYEKCLKFLKTRVELDLALFKEDIWSH